MDHQKNLGTVWVDDAQRNENINRSRSMEWNERDQYNDHTDGTCIRLRIVGDETRKYVWSRSIVWCN